MIIFYILVAVMFYYWLVYYKETNIPLFWSASTWFYQLSPLTAKKLFPLQKALHLRSTRTFKDDKGVVRKNGEEWLITMADTEAHIPNVYEEV